jgi:molybdopterin biosynthesis enzyme
VISEFGAAIQYLAEVVAYTVEGAGAGALPKLTSANGNIVVERLEGLDVGERVRVQLIDTNVERGYIDFKKLGTSRHE